MFPLGKCILIFFIPTLPLERIKHPHCRSKPHSKTIFSLFSLLFLFLRRDHIKKPWLVLNSWSLCLGLQSPAFAEVHHTWPFLFPNPPSLSHILPRAHFKQIIQTYAHPFSFPLHLYVCIFLIPETTIPVILTLFL